MLNTALIPKINYTVIIYLKRNCQLKLCQNICYFVFFYITFSNEKLLPSTSTLQELQELHISHPALLHITDLTIHFLEDNLGYIPNVMATNLH